MGYALTTQGPSDHRALSSQKEKVRDTVWIRKGRVPQWDSLCTRQEPRILCLAPTSLHGAAGEHVDGLTGGYGMPYFI